MNAKEIARDILLVAFERALKRKPTQRERRVLDSTLEDQTHAELMRVVHTLAGDGKLEVTIDGDLIYFMVVMDSDSRPDEQSFSA